MKNKTVKFYPAKKEYSNWFDTPVPAKKLIPEWYKNQSKYTNNEKMLSPDTGTFNETIKACMPIFDVITGGYIITTPADIYVTRNGESVNFSWSINEYTCIESHPNSQFDKFKIPDEFYDIGYKFINPWITKTPNGYSSLFIQPSLRDGLPFQCIPAIVDTDKHPIAVNFPFLLRRDFEGVIPMGTPMIQIIPFKREEWNHEVNEYEPKFWGEWKKAERKMSNRYKTFFRTLKEWN